MSNMSFLLPPSSALPVSTSPALIGNATVLLQGLMEGREWQDPQAEMSVEEARQILLDPNLKHAMVEYLEEQDTDTKAQLIRALEAALKATQAEAADALRQQAYYQVQAEREAQESLSLTYLGSWRQWALHSVKDFFGSTPKQLVEKYAALAEARQALMDNLTAAIDALQPRSEHLIADKVPKQQAPVEQGVSAESASPPGSVSHRGSSRSLSLVADKPSVELLPPAPVASFLSSSPALFPEILNLSDLNGKNGFKIDGELAGDSGSWISLSPGGDVNGDGWDDLLIGTRGYNNYTGRSYVVFGGPEIGQSGLLTLPSLNGVNGFKLDGEFPGDWSGHALAGGDVNGDHFADILIGSYVYNNNMGRSYLVLGGPNIGSSNQGVLSLSSLNGINGFKIDSETAGDQNGVSTAVGDVNGDQFADMLIGAQSHNNGAGRSYVLFGQPVITRSASFSLSNLNGTNGFKLDGVASGDLSGARVAVVGDTNGDRYNDVFIGAPWCNSGTGMGCSYVVFGGPGMSGGSVSLALATLNGDNGFRTDGEAIGDISGVDGGGLGDVNGDGWADLLIGAPGHNGSWPNGVGRSYVVFGNSTRGASFSLSSLNGIQGFKLDGEAMGDISGYSLRGVGDINDDGFPDFMIGSCTHNADTGRSYLVLGGQGVGSEGILSLSSLNGANGFKLDGESGGYRSGHYVSGVGDVNGDGLPDMAISAPGYNNAMGRVYVVFGDTVQIWTNQLVIHSGETFLFTANNLNATGTTVPTFNISDLQYGHFEQVFNPGQAIMSFNQSQVSSGQIQFIHDGSSSIPSYAVQATSRIASTPIQVAQIIFYPQPVLVTNQLIVHQGECLLMTPESFNVTQENYPSDEVIFSIIGLQHGQFQLAPFNASVLLFSEQQLESNQVFFMQDNSSNAPSYQVSISDPYFVLPPASAAVTFYRRPVLVSNQLSINQGQNLLMNASYLAVTADDYPSAQVTFTISGLQHGQFQLAPLNISVLQFSEQQLENNQVFFVQDNSSSAPSYQVGVSDPYFVLPPTPAAVTFYRRPAWLNNQLVIVQGGNVTLTSALLSVIDDYPPDQVLFTVSNVQHGLFQQMPLNNSLVAFSEQQLLAGEILFVQDGSANAPSYAVSLNDSYFTLGPMPASVDFDALPILVNNQLTIHRGQTVVLTASNLQATHNGIVMGNLSFFIQNCQYGYFQWVGTSSAPIIVFQQQNITDQRVSFVQDNSKSAPAYQVSVSDGWAVSAPSDAKICFNNGHHGKPNIGLIVGVVVGGAAIIMLGLTGLYKYCRKLRSLASHSNLDPRPLLPLADLSEPIHPPTKSDSLPSAAIKPDVKIASGVNLQNSPSASAELNLPSEIPDDGNRAGCQ